MTSERATAERPPETKPDLSGVDVQELRGRLGVALDRLDVLFKDIGPLLQEVGNLRAEVAVIYDELVRRGVLRPDARLEDGRTATS